MKPPKRIAAINDLSGASRCSLTTALPIISSMGINCCVMPTAILSNHTGYSTYFFEDCTSQMSEFSKKWKELDLKFDCIYSGFLGSESQIETVEKFVSDFKDENTLIVVDPVMGDNGEIYTTYTEALCDEMKRLVAMADIVTPNITEACSLSGYGYFGETADEDKLTDICKRICDLGAKSVVLTGCKGKKSISNFVYDGKNTSMYSSELVPKYYTGTGDVFASLIAGLATKGFSVFEATEFATDFVHKITTYSYEIDMDINEGVAYEGFLGLLSAIEDKQ